MKIVIPSIEDQQEIIFQQGIKDGIKQLEMNLRAKRYSPQIQIDDSIYRRDHLLRENEGWQAPEPELVKVYFRHFQDLFPDYGTDAKLAMLLGIHGSGNDRRIRAFKDGSKKTPYGIWRRFLVLTGRVPQDIIPVLGILR
ncbi:hypothetical protein ALO41_200217 [Pseudomonas amygdali pv. ulmi]|uniref:Carbon storage regulator CsrA n=1 Tax=Pseudomonas amygdali pv. ulmi TaxID=251720 RepID=A0A0Q0GWE8_PSEA0|nr:hypothetical protein [Pseudomonas amygdali]KPZ17813.1 hypothetical protein ALO41_200217 [Pseudomonas amygdali pv. ulmi]KWS11045.1 hypothetical protein AL065_06055 [Pseudomonas amygdali pv. ulmi]